ncbi:argininosuccinate synthase [Oenococcus oeni]|uniref:Argininosuccinate synthase n=6 Tax=Oenococcus oeni TaxID=1247 RepID=ASSY_OENOB|nr:argininosuccinate synthase [Oenococcus oeni]Q04FC0.1 RecName: Full=Argininosuccinate synthase; AltName: Full=Citrulline--aspartate ligase [Oenococcus oeni PSU-1]EAV39814.1 argininosuccinate synthase [Oenococcus oeni ATCC BAA-1163]ABJ56852.1 argininosuccinate synthase [Oenococcus oeni PSU-1]EJO01816.1 argininosuccinate synthase [Oenococcus oeni AWRIB418]EJO06925.1 argininosuccinate synthase [Oenococcus oeni AWRIB422]EJO07767.1 argininosuccinate synthase [Oenococcus oeni AWRIB548]
MADKIVLAYSGGLDTSVAIPWLKDKGYEVIAVSLDVGQHGKQIENIQKKALKIGAIQSFIIDGKDEFAENYVSKVIKSNALYEGEYPLVSALSRPLIIEKLVQTAHDNNAVAIAHGSTGKGNDQVRFEAAIHALDPEMKIEAPIRDFQWSREEEIEYAHQHNVPVPINFDSPYSIDENLWGRSNEAGILENPWNQAPADAYALTSPVEDTPDEADFVDIEFKNGLPISVNDQEMKMADLIVYLNKLAGIHGIGRIDHVENRLIGIKSREIYETPAAAVIMTAHKDLEDITLEHDVAHFKPIIEQKITNLIYNAMWISPLFDALNKFIDETQKVVNGTVKMKLYKGTATAVARKSENNSLYSEKLATYTSANSFDEQAAVGFMKLYTLPATVYEQVNHIHSKEKEEI